MRPAHFQRKSTQKGDPVWSATIADGNPDGTGTTASSARPLGPVGTVTGVSVTGPGVQRGTPYQSR